MSRTFRNINPFYLTEGASRSYSKEVIERYTDKRDGKAVQFVDAGDGIVVISQPAKKFFKRRTNKLKRSMSKAEICSAVMQMVQEQSEYDQDMIELYDRLAEDEEYENQRYSFLNDDDTPYDDFNREDYAGLDDEVNGCNDDWWFDDVDY